MEMRSARGRHEVGVGLELREGTEGWDKASMEQRRTWYAVRVVGRPLPTKQGKEAQAARGCRMHVLERETDRARCEYEYEYEYQRNKIKCE